MNSGKNLTCFKAYDIRGKLDEELDEDIVCRIGRATVQSLKAKTVVVGFDAGRHHSAWLKQLRKVFATPAPTS